jgi:ADP-heptose:LPS heptosyltransferase
MQWLKRRLLEWLLDKRHKSAFDPARVKKILIVRNDKIGDMIVSTPLLRELKAAWPGVAIDVAASSVNRDIVRDCPHVDRTIVWDHGSLWHNLKVIRQLRRQRYDLILSMSLRFSPAYQLYLKLLGGRHLHGPRIAKYGTHTGKLGMYDHTVDYPTDRHILQTYFDALGAYKPASIDYHYELYNVDAYAGKALAFRAGLADRYAGLVCFNYQGSCARRTLCRADAEALLRQLADRYPDHAIVVIHPPGDRARAAELVAASARQNVMLSFATAHVLELAALVRECELVVSPDTAVIHIASVYNKKVLGFYVNSGNHRWFYPMCDHFRVLLSPTDSISGIDSQAALSAIDELMAA